MIAGDRVWESAEIVGRERELQALEGFLSGERCARGLVLCGGPGIGKTTLWEAGIALARRHGTQVLVARPSSAESRMPFAALLDLLGELDPTVFDVLPAPQRTALDVALLRAEPGERPPEPRAIALGLLNVLRALAADGPLLVAIDDVQWLDGPSAGALTFAARRFEGGAIRFLLARRAARRPPLSASSGGGVSSASRSGRSASAQPAVCSPSASA
jgi:AAA ATPase domain